MNSLLSICEYTGYSSDYILFGNDDNNTTIKKVIRILKHLPEKDLNLCYEVIRSLKAHSDK